MDLWDSLKIMIRRWYVTLPVAMLCGIATVSFSSTIDSEYLADGVVFVKGPVVQEVLQDGIPVIEARNPYLGTGGTDTFARILAEAAVSSSTRQEFLALGLEPSYEVSVDRSEAIIDVEVRADDPDLAVDTVSRVLLFLALEAENRQLDVEGLDEAALISVEILSQSRAEEDNEAPRRVLGALAVASLIVTVGAAFLVEGIIRHRRGDRQSWAGESSRVEATMVPARAVEPLVSADDDRRTQRALSLFADRDRGVGPHSEGNGAGDSATSRRRWGRRVESQ